MWQSSASNLFCHIISIANYSQMVSGPHCIDLMHATFSNILLNTPVLTCLNIAPCTITVPTMCSYIVVMGSRTVRSGLSLMRLGTVSRLVSWAWYFRASSTMTAWPLSTTRYIQYIYTPYEPSSSYN